jgi:hypothetical protein
MPPVTTVSGWLVTAAALSTNPCTLAALARSTAPALHTFWTSALTPMRETAPPSTAETEE